MNKARLLEKIAELVKDKKIEGISELRDESDKDGMRVVIELRRGESGDVMLNQLYKQTQLQVVFGINTVALVDGQPRLLNLHEILTAFIRHRREVVTRRTIYRLRKARDRAHVLEGLAVALANIDPIIQLIRESDSSATAKARLVARTWEPGIVSGMLERAGAESSKPENLGEHFGLHDGQYQLTDTQAQAILDLRLHRLTGLEQEKIVEEYKEILAKIEDLLDILTNPDRLRQVIREELVAVIEQYGDARRTEIQVDHSEMTVEDLIADEPVVITLSHGGYAKAQPLSDYRAQRRGGRGKSATAMKDEDFVDKLFVASMHDTVLFFTSVGKVYWKRVYELPLASRGSRGRPIVNLLPLEDDERVNAVLTVRQYTADQYIFFATSKGVVKKTALTDFSRPRTNGIIAIDLRVDDYLIDVALTNGDSEVMLLTSGGRAMRFLETDVRTMGRTAAGVRGVRMPEEDRCRDRTDRRRWAGWSQGRRADRHAERLRQAHAHRRIPDQGSWRARRHRHQDHRSQRCGRRCGAGCRRRRVHADQQCRHAGAHRRVSEVSSLGRNTQGVRLIRLGGEEKLVELTAIEEQDADDAVEELLDDAGHVVASASEGVAIAVDDTDTTVPVVGDDAGEVDIPAAMPGDDDASDESLDGTGDLTGDSSGDSSGGGDDDGTDDDGEPDVGR